MPDEQLDRRVIILWQLEQLIWLAGSLAVLAAGFGAVMWRFFDWSMPVAALPLIVVLLITVPYSLLEPTWRYRSWRFAVSDDEVDTVSGVITRTRRLIPMARIQHVDTTRGPFERGRGLATVVIHTAAGSSSIPGLPAERATSIRDRIASLANTYEDL
jgi:hypothetical protein